MGYGHPRKIPHYTTVMNAVKLQARCGGGKLGTMLPSHTNFYGSDRTLTGDCLRIPYIMCNGLQLKQGIFIQAAYIIRPTELQALKVPAFIITRRMHDDMLGGCLHSLVRTKESVQKRHTEQCCVGARTRRESIVQTTVHISHGHPFLSVNREEEARQWRLNSSQVNLPQAHHNR